MSYNDFMNGAVLIYSLVYLQCSSSARSYAHTYAVSIKLYKVSFCHISTDRYKSSFIRRVKGTDDQTEHFLLFLSGVET